MIVRFSSTKTESIIMFGDVAVRLIKMLGSSGVIPGAISAEDIPTAVKHLRQQLQAQAAQHPVPENTLREDDDKEDREPEIALATQAVPLIALLERAGAANVPVMWEVS